MTENWKHFKECVSLNQSILKLRLSTLVLFDKKMWWFLSDIFFTFCRHSWFHKFIPIESNAIIYINKLLSSCELVPYFIKNISTFKDIGWDTFLRKNIENWWIWKTLQSAIWIFFSAWMGPNLYYYHDFLQKARGAIEL